MSDVKTKQTKLSVKAYIDAVEPPQRRKDARAIAKIMRRVTGKNAKMWGSSIVGYDSYRYVYESGREGDWPAVGFSPRKSALSVYIMPGFDAYPDLMKKLGKYKTGKSCLYINKLDDVDLEVLETLIKRSVADIHKRYQRT